MMVVERQQWNTDPLWRASRDYLYFIVSVVYCGEFFSYSPVPNRTPSDTKENSLKFDVTSKL